MLITKGEVVSNTDPMKSGHLTVKVDDHDLPVVVTYTTPFYSTPQGNDQRSYAGMFMPPKPGTQVLIGHEEHTSTWYYISSIVADNANATPKKKTNKLTGTFDHSYEAYHPDEEDDSYDRKPYPQKFGIGMVNGSNLTFSEKTSRELGNERYTRLQSESGMKLVMGDTGGQVVLDNGQQDGLTITRDSHKGSSLGPRNTQLKANGNNYILSENGTAELKSMGREVRVINKGIPDPSTGPKNGEVYIESQNNDIIIKVVSTTSRVFIDAQGTEGLVQLRAGGGGVSVFTDGAIDLNAKGDVSINSGGDINLQGDNIHLNQGQFSGKTDPTLNNRDLEEGNS
jgi:hypothetical protein